MVRTTQYTTFSNSPYFFDRGIHGTAQPITERINPHSRPIVSYYSPLGVGSHHYGEHHPMKPHRLTLTNALVMGYGLDKQIHYVYDPTPASQEELEAYHDHDYIDFLSRVTPSNQTQMRALIDSFNCTEDCPIFADVYDFCRMYAGGSLAGARKLCSGTTDIAINWSGGLHHAKRGEASGFCYVNDIVLAILELLRHYPRVLYIDIDIHHGDGVELAFYETDRVMTVSFHKYNGEFFPGTGKLDDTGAGSGKNYCINVPLQDGIDDDMYLTIFRTVINDTVTAYRPAAIVLQCGADSLGCDRLGAFNLSIAAHGECINIVRKFGVPLLVVGGGGYTIKNVSRCWTYETSVLVGADIPDELPATVYDAFFADSNWKLHPPLTGKVENQNSAASLQHIMTTIKKRLRYLAGAPSVAMQEIPPDLATLILKDDEELKTAEEREEDLAKRSGRSGGDRRVSEREVGKVAKRNEFYDGDDDQDQGDEDTGKGKGKGKEKESREVKVAKRGRGGTTTRRARGGRRARGRGRGRGASTSAIDAPSIDNSDDEGKIREDNTFPTPTVPASRGRGRGGGRVRATASSSTATSRVTPRTDMDDYGAAGAAAAIVAAASANAMMVSSDEDEGSGMDLDLYL